MGSKWCVQECVVNGAIVCSHRLLCSNLIENTHLSNQIVKCVSNWTKNRRDTRYNGVKLVCKIATVNEFKPHGVPIVVLVCFPSKSPTWRCDCARGFLPISKPFMAICVGCLKHLMIKCLSQSIIYDLHMREQNACGLAGCKMRCTYIWSNPPTSCSGCSDWFLYLSALSTRPLTR